MKWFIEALKKYAVFSGRARRKEYFGFIIFFIIFILLTFSLLILLDFNINNIFVKILFFIDIALLIPSYSVTVRRLHDLGYSGLFLHLEKSSRPKDQFLFFQDGDIGPNKYGDDPKKNERNLNDFTSMNTVNDNYQLNNVITVNSKTKLYIEPKKSIFYLYVKKNQQIQILGKKTIDGIQWIKAKTKNGDEGWFLESLYEAK